MILKPYAREDKLWVGWGGHFASLIKRNTEGGNPYDQFSGMPINLIILRAYRGPELLAVMLGPGGGQDLFALGCERIIGGKSNELS